MGGRSSLRGDAGMAREAAPSDSLAATGIGREQTHEVYQVAFEHESTPSRTITVRYEYRPQLIELGVMYMWYHTYRPVGPDAKPELALTPDQQRRVRQVLQ